MAISLIKVGDAIRASLINTLISNANGNALNGIIPTAVYGTGVTVSALGSVSFASASSVSVQGCFTGSYDNYRVVFNITSQTANADLTMRLASGGSGSTVANYSFMRGYDRGSDGTHSVAMITAASSWIITAGASSTQTNDGYMDLYGPALGQYTSGLVQSAVYNTTPQMYTTTTNVHNTTAASFDGFSIFPVSGAITGKLRVYGYNNLT